MRPLIFLLAILFSLFSCSNETKTGAENADTVKTTSDQTPVTDSISTPAASNNAEQKCNSTAGEKWSKILNTCIILVDHTRIEPKDASLDPSKPAYLVFDSVRVEIFLPTQENSVIIRKSTKPGEAEMWVSGPLTLRQVDGKYRLEDEGRLLYETNNK